MTEGWCRGPRHSQRDHAAGPFMLCESSQLIEAIRSVVPQEVIPCR